MNLDGNPVFSTTTVTSATGHCTFSTTDGIYWRIAKTSYADGLKIILDVYGNGNGAGKPASVDILSTDGSARNRDIFYIYVRYDGKILLHENDDTAKSYLKSADLSQES